jgi:hypothetical protein
MHNSLGTFVKEPKVKLIIGNPEASIGDEAQTITNESMARLNPSMPTPKNS